VLVSRVSWFLLLVAFVLMEFRFISNIFSTNNEVEMSDR